MVERIGLTSLLKNSLPWSKVTQISASHYEEQTAYASVSRFRINDVHPYIYRTHDGGKSWQQIISGLPDFGPVDTVREDPIRKGSVIRGHRKCSLGFVRRRRSLAITATESAAHIDARSLDP